MPRREAIQPEHVHVHETITRNLGNVAYAFRCPIPERGVHLVGMFDTIVPETLVDVVDVAGAREQLGSYPLRIVMTAPEVHDPQAVREVIAHKLPDILAQHDAKPGTDQLPLW